MLQGFSFLSLLAFSVAAIGDNTGTDKANATTEILLDNNDFTLELNFFNKFSNDGKKIEFHGELALDVYSAVAYIEAGFCI